MNLKDKLFNRNKASKENSNLVGEWKDPQVTHHPTDIDDSSIAIA